MDSHYFDYYRWDSFSGIPSSTSRSRVSLVKGGDMPHKARKAKGGGWNIVNKNTGKKVGHSTTKKKAQSSARARDAAAHGWKPTKR